ncbi:MAG: hypothetical protein ABSE04_03435 [Candidatus Microgenomates bacterium]|jgi:hypothetical protein
MPGPFYEPHFGAFLDEAEKLRRGGNEIYMLLSNGIFDIGDTGSKNLKECPFCVRYSRKYIKKVSEDFHINTIESYMARTIKYKRFKYDSVLDIKKINYKGAKIGFACLSTYISRTRNFEPLINENFRLDFDELLFHSSILTDGIEKAINDIKPNLVYLFNGRFFDSRPVFDIARKRKIDTRCMDVAVFSNNIFVKQISKNAMLHNIKENISQTNNSWDLSSISLKNKTITAKDYFQKRRSGIYTDGFVYVKNQKKGLLPEGFDRNKQNIAIFNTSEDEYAAIDDEFDKLSLFKTQIEGLEYIFNTFKNNGKIHFYLRIHPNLSGIKYKYHTDLYLFPKKYNNVTVIPPDSKISSYSLLDAVEKVITFGSSMGVEANYWNKPSILLSGSIYYYLNICYKPKNRSQLKKMIVLKLKLKDKTDALKYAFYYTDKDPQKLPKHVDFTMHHFNFLGWNIRTSNYKKLFGSPRLFSLYLAVKERLYGHAKKHQIKF